MWMLLLRVAVAPVPPFSFFHAILHHLAPCSVLTCLLVCVILCVAVVPALCVVVSLCVYTGLRITDGFIEEDTEDKPWEPWGVSKEETGGVDSAKMWVHICFR